MLNFLKIKGPTPVDITVNDLLTGYFGRWLQLGASNLVFKTFERGGICANALYTTRSDTDPFTFDVRNGQIIARTGLPQYINGVATVPNRDDAAAINVSFGTAEFLPSFGKTNYLVVGLGPFWNSTDPDYSSGYEWAVVTDSFKLFSFVLGRYPEAYENNKDEIDAITNAAGIDKAAFFGNPLIFDDFSDCPKEFPFAE